MQQGLPSQHRDPNYIPPHRAREAQEIYQELQDMDTQLKIWEMIIDYLSTDFVWTIIIVFLGVSLIKSIGVFERWLSRKTEDNENQDT